MAFKQFILPALALAGHALAQCEGPSITIETSADAEEISSCRTYQGDVIISESASGTISLNGVQAIAGDLRCDNATQLTAITGDRLASIGGSFNLQRLTILSGLQFDSLSAAAEIQWISLPALQSLNFGSGIKRANNVEISDTALTSLAGIELEAVTTMNINNNKYMSKVDVNNLANVTRGLTFAANSEDLEISLPNLEDAANLTFINVSAVSLPSLAEVGGSIGFYFDNFESFSAPNLTETGGDIAFVSCGSLSNLSFPQLTKIGGGFLVANNTELVDVDQFPKLETIAGALDFAGAFETVTFESLKDVRGGANVQSSSDNEDLCTQFDKASDRRIIKGTTKCAVKQADPQTNGTSTDSSSSSSSSSGAANPSVFNPSAPLTGLSAVIAALLFI